MGSLFTPNILRKGYTIMLIKITPKGSGYTVVASTWDKSTLEGLNTLYTLYERMLHLQDRRGYVYDNPDTIAGAVWDYVGYCGDNTQVWEVSHEPSVIRELITINSRSVTTPRQVGSIRLTLNQHNKISEGETVFSADGMFYEDFHFTGQAMDEDGYREPKVLEGVLIDELDELTYEELKHLRDKVYHQPDSVMWVYDYGGGTYTSTRP